MPEPAGYSDSVLLAAGLPFSDTSVSFVSWTATAGNYVARCSVYLASDQVRVNDTTSRSFVVTSNLVPGWQEKSSMPLVVSGKPVGDGGWLAEDGDVIYAAKGNKTSDFYRYNVESDSWYKLAPIPDGREAKKPGKGAVGVSGGGFVYAVKGNNSTGFYRYSTARDSWYQLADIPLDTTNKKVKGGTDVIYADDNGRNDTDHVYLLKGYKTEFWRYDVNRDSWGSDAGRAARHLGQRVRQRDVCSGRQ